MGRDSQKIAKIRWHHFRKSPFRFKLSLLCRTYFLSDLSAMITLNQNMRSVFLVLLTWHEEYFSEQRKKRIFFKRTESRKCRWNQTVLTSLLRFVFFWPTSRKMRELLGVFYSAILKAKQMANLTSNLSKIEAYNNF